MNKREKENVFGIYLTSLQLRNVHLFGNEAKLNLSDERGNWTRWNVILGNNGVGKTSLLKALVLLSYTQWQSPLRKSFFWQLTSFWFPEYGVVDDSVWMRLEVKNETNRYGDYAVCIAGRKINKFFRLYPHRGLLIIGYGANRTMGDTGISGLQHSPDSETLFDEYIKLVNAEEWLLSMDYAASRESNLKLFAEQRRQLIIEVLKEILPGVTDIRFTTPTKVNLVPKVEFKTDYGWTGIHQLSLGYKTMVAWIVDVAARMFERYPDSDNPLAEPVVILVDEIDLHLHPKWQRKIFDFLTEKFPRAQFIVTAHSPLVVQSAPKDANIILLRQETDEEGNAYVKIDNDVESVRNWRLDQIMTSDLFGLESTRNPEVERLLNDRKELLQKDDLTTEEADRLKELNNIADGLPTAEDPTDRKAMEVIREAAEVLRNKAEVHD